MRTLTTSLLLAASVFSAGTAFAKVVTEEVTYEADGIKMKGLIAHDDATEGKRPGVLVVHEWWGHNDYARSRAKKLAQMGYVALAVDMYGGGKTAAHPDDAGKFAGAVMNNVKGAKKRFLAAKARLAKHPNVDASKTAAIGYCFGGGVVLHMARMGVDLDVVGSFHGSLGTKSPASKGAIKGKLFVANGAADPFVSAEAIDTFKKEMKDAGADLTFVNYPGVQHSFTNPGATAVGKKFKLPLVYDAKADAASWKTFSEMMKKTFGG